MTITVLYRGLSFQHRDAYRWVINRVKTTYSVPWSAPWLQHRDVPVLKIKARTFMPSDWLKWFYMIAHLAPRTVIRDFSTVIRDSSTVVRGLSTVVRGPSTVVRRWVELGRVLKYIKLNNIRSSWLRCGHADKYVSNLVMVITKRYSKLLNKKYFNVIACPKLFILQFEELGRVG